MAQAPLTHHPITLRPLAIYFEENVVMLVPQVSIRSNADLRQIEARPLSDYLQGLESTYEALRRGMEMAPERVAIYQLREGTAEETPLEISFAQLFTRITQAANAFHSVGVGKDDTVSLLMPLLPQTQYALWGAEAAGIACPINPLLEPHQLRQILRAAETKVLVTVGPAPGIDIWEKVEAIRADIPSLKTIFQVRLHPQSAPPNEALGIHDFDRTLAAQEGERLISGRIPRGEDIAAYFHTGGTTGTPKLAIHTHLAEVFQAWNTATLTGIAPGQVIPAGLPMFHVGGAIVCSLVPLANGAGIVMLTPSGFRNPKVIGSYWKLCERYGCHICGAVPTVLSALLNVPLGESDLQSVQLALTGGSAMPVEVAHAFEKHSGLKVIEGYGMTEVCGYSTMVPKDGPMMYGSVGYSAPYVETKTVRIDTTGAYAGDCSTDEIGVVVMRGPCAFSGYRQEEHQAQAFIAEGWVNSGDLGRIDAQGRLWITGRAKDLIIRGGHNIDPQVIEEVLHAHPAVELAAAVGQPDGYAGELPVAYVQLKPGQEGEPTLMEALQAFARERISERAAAPVRISSIETMPLTAVGKIFKPQLRQDAIRIVFEEQLQAHLEGAPFTLTVQPDARHGVLAEIILPPDAPHDSEQRITACLAPYTVRHTVRRQREGR